MIALRSAWLTNAEYDVMANYFELLPAPLANAEKADYVATNRDWSKTGVMIHFRDGRQEAAFVAMLSRARAYVALDGVR